MSGQSPGQQVEGRRWKLPSCTGCGGTFGGLGDPDCTCDRTFAKTGKHVEVMPVEDHRRLLQAEKKATWDQQEARIQEYAEANTSQKHRIRELEAKLSSAVEKLEEQIELKMAHQDIRRHGAKGSIAAAANYNRIGGEANGLRAALRLLRDKGTDPADVNNSCPDSPVDKKSAENLNSGVAIEGDPGLLPMGSDLGFYIVKAMREDPMQWLSPRTVSRLLRTASEAEVEAEMVRLADAGWVERLATFSCLWGLTAAAKQAESTQQSTTGEKERICANGLGFDSSDPLKAKPCPVHSPEYFEKRGGQ